MRLLGLRKRKALLQQCLNYVLINLVFEFNVIETEDDDGFMHDPLFKLLNIFSG